LNPPNWHRAAVAAVVGVFPSSSSCVASSSLSSSTSSTMTTSLASTSVVLTTTTTTTASSIADRVLFGSWYACNIDVATQLMRPPDMILQGGSSSMSAAECSLEQDSDLDDDRFIMMSNNVSPTSTNVGKKFFFASSLKEASSNRTSRMAQSPMTAIHGRRQRNHAQNIQSTRYFKREMGVKKTLMVFPPTIDSCNPETGKWRKSHGTQRSNGKKPTLLPHHLIPREKTLAGY